YTLTPPGGLAANITSEGVTIASGLSANNKVYDGTTAATISLTNVILTGVIGGDTVSLSTNGYAASFASAGVGTGIGVTVSGLSLTGPSASNYTLIQPVELTANITAEALTIGSAAPPPVITSILLTNGVVTITWNSVTGGIYRMQYINNLNGGGWTDLSPDVTATGSTATQTNAVGSATQRFYRVVLLNPGLSANNKVYDGTTAATINLNNVVLVGVVSGDSVSLVTNGYLANFASAGVGTNIPVRVGGLTLSGTSAGNYTLMQPAITANITKAVLIVMADNQTRPYGVTNPVLTASYSGFVNGENTNVLSGSPVLSTTATLTSPAGAYPITVSQGTLSATNYSFSFTSGTLTVTAVSQPAIISISLTNGVITITWSSVAGMTYRVQATGSLNNPNWTNLPPAVTATGPTASKTDVIGNTPQRFYRVMLMQVQAPVITSIGLSNGIVTITWSSV